MTAPRLDLAPKLNRPLQLWNPLDYLRLLYWVFFFPHALRWYTGTFASIEYAEGMEWQKKLRTWWSHSVYRRLLIQALGCTIGLLLLLTLLLQMSGVSLKWVDVMIGWGIGITLGLLFGIAFGLIVTLAVGVIVWMTISIGVSLFIGISFNVMVGTAGGIVISVLLGLSLSVIAISATGVVLGVPVMVLVGLLVGTVIGIKFDISAGVAAGLIVSLSISRLDNWLLGLICLPALKRTGEFQDAFLALFPRVSPIPLPKLQDQLREWLLEDWKLGLHNAGQLLRYSLQMFTVLDAFDEILTLLPEKELLSSIAQLLEMPYGYGWDIVWAVSASVRQVIKQEIVGGAFSLAPRSWESSPLKIQNDMLRVDTPARAAASGFLYLYNEKPQKALQAFSAVQALHHGEEMCRLSRALLAAQAVESLADIAQLAQENDFFTAVVGTQDDVLLPDEPSATSPQVLPLHPSAWEALAHLQRVTRDAWTVQIGASPAARSKALNRALGEINTLLSEVDNIPEAERSLMQRVAIQWQSVLLAKTGEVDQMVDPKPVTNPYTVGDPVLGLGFVGRRDVFRQLEEFWIGSQSPPSVVLFGHRRMGKTSILRNLKGHLGSTVHLAYVNLLSLGSASGGAGDLLLAIADEVEYTLQEAGYSVSSVDADLLQRYPQRVFKRFLRSVREILEDIILIIALDEFEQLEEWMESGQLSRDFLKVLRAYIHLDRRIAFTFAGLHTLEEMTFDYFEPFFASVTPVKVGFLSKKAVFQLLTNPTEDFTLDYTPEALEQIWKLTGGQPYLVQLLGHRLVSRYNDLIFEEGRYPDPRFDSEDVEMVVKDKTFYQMGRYYFTGVWRQAETSEPSGQTAVLGALALVKTGLPAREIARRTDISLTEVEGALKSLARHDVVQEEEDGRWRFTVELMRRWVLQREEE
jgi:DNA-binding transcriptional ArsR family regulator